LVAAACAPRDLPAGLLLRFVGDAHALLARLLAEPLDPRPARGRDGRLVCAVRVLGLGEGADDQDLLAISGDLGRTGEPVVRQSAGEPALQGCGAQLLRHVVITSLQVLLCKSHAARVATMPPTGGTVGASS